MPKMSHIGRLCSFPSRSMTTKASRGTRCTASWGSASHPGFGEGSTNTVLSSGCPLEPTRASGGCILDAWRAATLPTPRRTSALSLTAWQVWTTLSHLSVKATSQPGVAQTASVAHTQERPGACLPRRIQALRSHDPPRPLPTPSPRSLPPRSFPPLLRHDLHLPPLVDHRQDSKA